MENIGMVEYAQNSCSTFACHIWILKRVASWAARCWIYDIIFILYHNQISPKQIHIWALSKSVFFLKAYTSSTVEYLIKGVDESVGRRWEIRPPCGLHIERNQQLAALFPKPRPYAIFRETVHSKTLRIFGTIQSFIISRQLLLWCFQYYFLLFLFCSVTI